MSAASYIPAKDADFTTWLDNFSALITAAPATYGLIAGDAVIIAGVTSAWDAAIALATNPATRTPVTIGDKDAARAAAEAIVRPYATNIAANAGVTNGDKLAVGVTVRKTIPTPVPPPLTSPTLSLVAAAPLQHQLAYRDTATPSSKAKPAGSIGLQVFRAVGVAPAVDPAQASYYDIWTKSPNVSSFLVGDVGKVATYFGRWQTRGGPGGSVQYGPWSAPLVLTVM